MLSPKTQTNLKNAKGYFEEHLSVGDYYAENHSVNGEWIGLGAALLGLKGGVNVTPSSHSVKIRTRFRTSS